MPFRNVPFSNGVEKLGMVGIWLVDRGVAGLIEMAD
jgi:uncharacterized membrane protein